MAPLTRFRADGHHNPYPHAATYYEQQARAAIEVEVRVGGMPFCLLTLSPGEKTLAFEGVTFISMLSLSYHDVQLRPKCLLSAHHLHLIYANLPNDTRLELGRRSVIFVTPEKSRSARTRTDPVLRSGALHSFRRRPSPVKPCPASSLTNYLALFILARSLTHYCEPSTPTAPTHVPPQRPNPTRSSATARPPLYHTDIHYQRLMRKERVAPGETQACDVVGGYMVKAIS